MTGNKPLTEKLISRRDFVRTSALAGAGLVATISSAENKTLASKPPSFNPNMEYRRLGKTGLMLSAVVLGGHWKRVEVMLKSPFKGVGFSDENWQNINNAEFIKSRTDVISRCIDVGINYVDACAGPEVLAYSKALKGRRDRMYLGYSWSSRESRFAEWRSAKKLLESLEMGMRDAQLDYVDLWRITMPMGQVEDIDELQASEQGAVEALAMAKKQGKARFTGVSTHNRVWLKSMIEDYPQQMEVVLFPYTASSMVLPYDSLFETVKKYDVGVLGIKPFADNALFKGNSSPQSPMAEEDNRRARLAIRYILNNPAITAPMAGMISPAQVDNVAQAVMERRKLDEHERAELKRATDEMWAKLPSHYDWLRDWQNV